MWLENQIAECRPKVPDVIDVRYTEKLMTSSQPESLATLQAFLVRCRSLTPAGPVDRTTLMLEPVWAFPFLDLLVLPRRISAFP